MKRMIGLLFDMDGVVCHNMPAHEEAWRQFLRGHDIDMDLNDFRSNTMGMPTREVLRYYLKRDIPPDEAARLSQDKENLYRRIYRSKRRAAFFSVTMTHDIKIGQNVERILMSKPVGLPRCLPTLDRQTDMRNVVAADREPV